MTTSIVTMLVVPFRLFRWIKKVTPAHLLHAMKFRQHLDPTSIHHVRMFEQYEPPRLFCCQISAVKARFCSFNSFFFSMMWWFVLWTSQLFVPLHSKRWWLTCVLLFMMWLLLNMTDIVFCEYKAIVLLKAVVLFWQIMSLLTRPL